MTLSMKACLYRVYPLLGKEGELATIKKVTWECAAGYVLLSLFLITSRFTQ